MSGPSLRAVLYCRLSKEDDDAGLRGESESIQNQRALLTAYAAEQGYTVTGEYRDEDYSGADRDRPGFRRLIEAAERREFDVLLVKTQSRFTRDMELVEKYIHHDFLLWGIRFIAVVDHVDTGVRGGKKARQINGLINEWYLEDLSENIRAVLDVKRRSGQFIGSFPLYGYRKDPADHNHLLPDEEAAAVVRDIFRRYLAGEGTQRIADALNAAGIPNPTAYKQQKGLRYCNGGAAASPLWSRTTVSRILREEQYTGVLLQGKRRKLSYKSKTLRSVPRAEWFAVPEALEALVDRETFEAAGRLLDGHIRSSGGGKRHALAGKVRCLSCGGPLSKISDTYKGTTRFYLRCPRCAGHTVRLDWLEEAVRGRLCAHLARYFSPAAVPPAPSARQAAGETRKREMQTLREEIGRRDRALRTLYLDKADGLLDAGEFAALQTGYREERARFEKRLALLAAQEEAAPSRQEEPLLAHYVTPAHVPQELLDAFLDTVMIGPRDPAGEQPLQIRWKF